jgi:deoxyribodipyrimidine photo-lyase
MAQQNKALLSTYPAPKAQVVPEDILKLAASPAYSTIPDSAAELGFPLPPLKIDLLKEWPAGEQEALARLDKFLAEKGAVYQTDRDFPWKRGTSRLSPYLAAGVISSRTCLLAAKQANQEKFDSGNAGLVTWISELIWREFYRGILVAYPRVCMDKAFKADTDSIPWSYDKEAFEKWAQGRTGYPIVDVGSLICFALRGRQTHEKIGRNETAQ